MSDLVPSNNYSVAVGTSSTSPFVTHFDIRDPTPQDVNYPVQKQWVNTVLEKLWILRGFSSLGGIITAEWMDVSAGISAETLTGNTGGPVGIDALNNINVVGDVTTITIAGNPGTHTLTASTSGAVAVEYDEDTGTAVPVGGVLNVFGTPGNITTAGAGNTITIDTGGNVPIEFDEDTGTAVPSLGILNVLGTLGHVTTSGSGNTITIDTGGDIATVYDEDVGSATPVAGVLNVLGGTGISTSGAGNTITITNTSPGSTITFDEDSGTATPSLGILNVLGTSGHITTTGAGNTITIDSGGDIATTYTEDSGSATPALGVLNVLGGTNIATSGAGNTVTITNTMAGSGTSSFCASLSAPVNNVTGDGTPYQIIFDSVNFDTGSNYNALTGVFTAPAAGIYQFTAVVMVNNLSLAFTNELIRIVTSSGSFSLIPQINPGVVFGGGNGLLGLGGSLTINLINGGTAFIEVIVSGSTKTVGINDPGISGSYFCGSKLA